jgi:hypothetical protein
MASCRLAANICRLPAFHASVSATRIPAYPSTETTTRAISSTFGDVPRPFSFCFNDLGCLTKTRHLIGLPELSMTTVPGIATVSGITATTSVAAMLMTTPFRSGADADADT